ncbi:MAG: hypothetical protein DSY37_03280 [Hyperthermus sp.]|nr:MAG: hypothetical protein DSY37_03280 [Hyperthermus sp.]
MLGFERDELLLVHSSIVAAHVTGFEHFYDYVVESYYELAEGDDSLLAQPRWKKLFWVVEEEVAALVEFEERLADEDTMKCAEPLLAAAIVGLVERKGNLSPWILEGYSSRRGEQLVRVRAEGDECTIVVPGPLYSLYVAGLVSLGMKNPMERVEATVPDPSYIRRRVYESHTPFSLVSKFLRELVASAVKTALDTSIDAACSSGGSGRVLAVKYHHRGVIEPVYAYIC